MQSQLVFQQEKEMERLRVQNSLLLHYEEPILAQLFSQRSGLAVLDVGCNDGTKTVERFSSGAVSHVIGLEYNAELAARAQKTYGSDRFFFCPLDVEADGLVEKLHALMRERSIEGFDVIYLSFVLMHLSDTKKLLRRLQPFLKKDGKLLIIEANDAASTLSSDAGGLLGEFLAILREDRYSGNRGVGGRICEELAECGYEEICVWHEAVSAGEGELEKKEAIFTTFFSYLPEDVILLLEAEPDNEKYKAWADWVDRNHQTLRRLIMQEQSVISMGMKILTCSKGMKENAGLRSFGC